MKSTMRLHRRILSFIVLCILGLVSVTAPVTAQDRPLVVIDPGHGGEDNGVVLDGWVEKDLILEMSFIIGAEFVKAGYDVVYTRTTDAGVAWPDRRTIAEEAGAALLLMLHANRDEEKVKHGAEVYLDVENEASQALADRIAASFTEMGSAVLIEGKPWPFLKSTTVPTAMVEVAFMSHPVDSRLLKTSEFHHDVGQAFVAAAEAFLATR